MRKLGVFLLGLAAVLFSAGVARAATSQDEGGNAKFTIHGEVRFRGEWWDNLTDFTDSGTSGAGFNTNDSFDIFPYRVRLAAKGDLGHDVWVYGEFQGAGVAGGGLFGQTDPLFGDSFELFTSGVSLYQGYVKLKDVGKTNLDLTIGRQEIVFDRGLHFSSLDFYNGISHDGVMANWEWDKMDIAAFWTRPVESNLGATTLSPNSGADNDLLGVHVGWMRGKGKEKDQDIAVYAFFQTMNSTALIPGDDRGKIYTVGARWGRMLHGRTGFVWNAEGSYQFGDFQPCAAPAGFTGACVANAFSQRAMVIEGAFGYMWHKGKTDQKVWGGYTLASGDDDPTDTDNSSFIPLYTDFHDRLGYADLFTISNIHALSAGWKMSKDDKHIFGAAVWKFTQDNSEAGNFSPLSGFTVAGCSPGGGISCNDDLGDEIDLFYDYNMTQNFSFDTALSWFSPGDAIKDSQSGFGAFNAGDDAGYRLTAQARARF